MVIDKVSHEVKNDPLICEFGDRLLEKHGDDRSKDGHVSQKMRELGRFLVAAKSLDYKVKMLQDVLVPPKFSLAVAAARKASGFTNSKYRYRTPSLALKLGHSLKAVCDILIGHHVKAEDETAAGRVRSFLGLVAAEWDLYVSRRARTNLEEDRWNKKEMIPLTEDVMKLHNVLKSTEEEAAKKILEGPDPTAYRTLKPQRISTPSSQDELQRTEKRGFYSGKMRKRHSPKKRRKMRSESPQDSDEELDVLSPEATAAPRTEKTEFLAQSLRQ
ncbi:uncharacterized protein AKAME5_002232800 [Lates japonicus]|uniref:Uncharacterized protein n=1 Tax=Lates japonicus TaxID=270547 RepID=A0AAD3NDF4_LATJO|nr:uncharacterized protein AKAME5_002232800 [Lates japonicus]